MPTPNEHPTQPDPMGITITRHLPIPLTEKRKLQLLDELSSHITVAKQLEKLKKDSADSYAKSIKQHWGERDSIAETVAQGVEMQPVACRKEIDYIHGRMTIIRLDTGEILEDKALEEEDLKP